MNRGTPGGAENVLVLSLLGVMALAIALYALPPARAVYRRALAPAPAAAAAPPASLAPHDACCARKEKEGCALPSDAIESQAVRPPGDRGAGRASGRR